MAAFKLPVLMNRWELFSISASVVYMYTIPSDVLKDLLKTTSFLNFVKHCLSALVCHAICVLYQKSFK